MSYTKNWTERFVPPRRVNVNNGVSTSFQHSAISTGATKSGQTNPQWRKRKEAGEFVASPYSCSQASALVESPGATFQAHVPAYGTDKWRSYSFQGTISPPAYPSHNAVDTAATANKALARILEKIREEQQTASLLPALGELRSTIRQFGAPAEAIVDLTNRRLNKLEFLAQGYKTGAWRPIPWHRVVASTYLEYAFGLAPLIEDTRKTAEALARWNFEADNGKPLQAGRLLRAGADSTWVDVTQSSDYATGTDWLHTRNTINRRTEYGVRYLVRLKDDLQADFGSNDRLMQLLGFDPAQFAPTVWELVPWSWLADYFLNIQQIIEAGVTRTSHVDGIVKSVRTFSEQEIIEIPRIGRDAFPANPDLRYRAVDIPPVLCRSVGRRTDFVRTCPSSLGVPTLEFSYPNSFRKLANMTAAMFARKAKSSAMWLY